MDGKMDGKMYKFQVGALYNPNRTQWPECAQFMFRGGGTEMVLFFLSPTEDEIEGVRKGRAEFAVAVHEGVIFFCYQFGRYPAATGASIPWSDATFSWWLVPEGERSLPNPEPTTDERNLMVIHLVDASTGILLVIRAVSLPPPLSSALNSAIRDQASRPWGGAAAHDAAIARVYRKFPDALALVKSGVRGVAGE